MTELSRSALIASGFVKVFRSDELADPGKRLCEVSDRLVVVFHVANAWYCLDDVCTHDGGPLGEGRLDGFRIACPRHGAQFDIRDGRHCTMPATEDTLAHEVRVDAGEVYVRVVSH